jgi:NAD(P)H-dependent flavin oxidoreductase YrpB (nitropropane dioxygenase family)
MNHRMAPQVNREAPARDRDRERERAPQVRAEVAIEGRGTWIATGGIVAVSLSAFVMVGAAGVMVASRLTTTTTTTTRDPVREPTAAPVPFTAPVTVVTFGGTNVNIVNSPETTVGDIKQGGSP